MFDFIRSFNYRIILSQYYISIFRRNNHPKRIIQYPPFPIFFKNPHFIHRGMYLIISRGQHPFPLFINDTTFPGLVIHTAITIMKYEVHILPIIFHIGKPEVYDRSAFSIDKPDFIISNHRRNIFRENPCMSILFRDDDITCIAVKISTPLLFTENDQGVRMKVCRYHPIYVFHCHFACHYIFNSGSTFIIIGYPTFTAIPLCSFLVRLMTFIFTHHDCSGNDAETRHRNDSQRPSKCNFFHFYVLLLFYFSLLCIPFSFWFVTHSLMLHKNAFSIEHISFLPRNVLLSSDASTRYSPIFCPIVNVLIALCIYKTKILISSYFIV